MAQDGPQDEPQAPLNRGKGAAARLSTHVTYVARPSRGSGRLHSAQSPEARDCRKNQPGGPVRPTSQGRLAARDGSTQRSHQRQGIAGGIDRATRAPVRPTSQGRLAARDGSTQRSHQRQGTAGEINWAAPCDARLRAVSRLGTAPLSAVTRGKGLSEESTSDPCTRATHVSGPSRGSERLYSAQSPEARGCRRNQLGGLCTRATHVSGPSRGSGRLYSAQSPEPRDCRRNQLGGLCTRATHVSGPSRGSGRLYSAQSPEAGER